MAFGAATWFAGLMAELAMFPLGSVLFPHMPLLLRVFEPRYLVMLSRLLESDTAEFGVVLIERGQEVGGGEHRFSVGTVATVTEMGTADGTLALVAQGGRRIEVVDWLPEDPHPVAEVRVLPELIWSEDDRGALENAERVVRRSLARASEFVEGSWSADVALSDDPAEASWQLAGIAPLGELDQVALLRSTSFGSLLASVSELTAAAGEIVAPAWLDPVTDAGAAGDIDDGDDGDDDPLGEPDDDDDEDDDRGGEGRYGLGG